MTTEHPRHKPNIAAPAWRIRTQDEADAIEKRALAQEPTSLVLERGLLVWIPRTKAIDGEQEAHS